MKTKIMITLLVASLAINGALIVTMSGHSVVTPAMAQATKGENLVDYMGRMQRLAHKAGLAIDAGNKDLAGFYSARIEQTIGEIERNAPAFGNFQTGALAKAMLAPFASKLTAAVNSGDMAAASTAYDAMLNGCNTCHVATQHQYVKITRVKTNPFAQSFK